MIRSLALLAALWLLTGTTIAESQVLDVEQARVDEAGIAWYDVQLLPIEGQGWSDTLSEYDRLPAKAEAKVRDVVWNLSRHSSGIAVRFVSDAPAIHARWELTSPRLAMSHMPATGVSGVDLYVRDDSGRWRWLACGQPKEQSNTRRLVSGIPEGRRTYMLYLPLYNGVTSLELGIPQESQLATPEPRPTDRQKPIVFYGTSITHGASASRPGMTHVAILGRRFDRPVINLGLSGNGKMETEVARLLTEIDAAVYVIDCLPNIDAGMVLERTRPCIEILRAARPRTPILLVEDRSYGDSFLIASKRERNRTSREALRQVYSELKADGVEHLYYLEGAHLLGDDNEGTVDSSHPTDLGFMRQAAAFADALGPILDASE